MLLKLEGVIHVPQLELNIGYYHIDLSPGVKQFCTIVLPWVKCKYQNKSMGVCNCPNFPVKYIQTLQKFLYGTCVHIRNNNYIPLY